MPTAQAYILNIILAFIPDFLICWAAMKLTDDQWSTFWITFAALQAIYFFFWLKTALWSWLLFWIYGRSQMATHLENFFIEHRFPVPSEYTIDLDDYLSETVVNEELDCETRIRAGFENGTLNGFKIGRRYALVMQLNSASKIALKRYRKMASRYAQA